MKRACYIIVISTFILHSLGALQNQILRFPARRALPIGPETWVNPDLALQPLQGETTCSPAFSLDSAILQITDFATESLLDNETINGIGFSFSRGCSLFESKENHCSQL
jgi:hypothetical protein